MGTGEEEAGAVGGAVGALTGLVRWRSGGDGAELVKTCGERGPLGGDGRDEGLMRAVQQELADHGEVWAAGGDQLSEYALSLIHRRLLRLREPAQQILHHPKSLVARVGERLMVEVISLDRLFTPMLCTLLPIHEHG